MCMKVERAWIQMGSIRTAETERRLRMGMLRGRWQFDGRVETVFAMSVVSNGVVLPRLLRRVPLNCYQSHSRTSQYNIH